MSDPHQTTSQIESELLAEVQSELVRRGTSQIKRKREPEDDTLAALAISAILACLAALAGTGVMMALVYTPSVEDANASTAWLQAGTLGAIARGAHWHAANLLVLLSAAYLGYLLWRGLFRRPGHWRWWRAALLLLLVLGFGFTGQLLPYDQLAVHGTSIRLGYLAEAPVIGEPLRQLLQGGESIGTATLARFFGLHGMVLPALTLILLRWLWRDGRSEASLVPQLGVAGVVVALVFAAAFVFAAPLGLQGDLGEPFPEARPEWYALAPYALLKVAPGGVAQQLILFAAPLLMLAVVLALPFIETLADEPQRLRKPLQIGLIAGAAALLIFTAVPLFQDTSAKEGWFVQHQVPDIMTQMTRRNDALLHETQSLPADTHLYARDLELLNLRLIGNYPEKIDDAGRVDWDQWANNGAAAARRLLLAPDAAAQDRARAELRKACMTCHQAHDKEDVRLQPAAPVVAAEPEPAAAFFMDQAQLAALPHTPFERTTTKRLMDQMKFRLRDVIAHAGVIEHTTDRSAEQNMVDLLAAIELVGKQYADNEGSIASETDWNRWMDETRKATQALAKARNPGEVASLSKEVGRACEGCHDASEDIIEWRFESLLKPK